MILMLKKFFRKFGMYHLTVVVGREPMKDHDMKNEKEFVISTWCQTQTKKIRNRIYGHMEIASDPETKDEDRKIAIARIQELKDILNEWANLREDLKVENDND